MSNIAFVVCVLKLVIRCECSWSSPTSTLIRNDSDIVVGAYNDTIFLLGGYTYKKQMTEYRIDTDTFIDIGETALPINMFGYSQSWTQIEEIIYMIETTGTALSIFNMATREFTSQWKSITLQEDVNIRACLAASDDSLFITGGGLDPELDTLQILNLETYQWKNNTPPMQQSRRVHACAVHYGYLWVFSGYTRKTNERINITDITSNQWSYIDNLTMNVYAYAARATAWQQSIFIIGGCEGDAGCVYLDTVHITDAVTGEITLSPDKLVYVISDHGIALIQNVICLFGGDSSNGMVNTWMQYLDPTNDPTTEPTADPTVEPTVDPTIDPTIYPTNDPTNDPTQDPTADPTVDPSTEPTKDPTIDPTLDPTTDPIIDPTKDPTVDPTRDPTTAPTFEPTQNPTSFPTTLPTINPTIDPTIDPTQDPTVNPTADPTLDPTTNTKNAVTIEQSLYGIFISVTLSINGSITNEEVINTVITYLIANGVDVVLDTDIIQRGRTLIAVFEVSNQLDADEINSNEMSDILDKEYDGKVKIKDITVNTHSDDDSDQDKSHKNNRFWIILGVCVLSVVLLICGGTAVWFKKQRGIYKKEIAHMASGQTTVNTKETPVNTNDGTAKAQQAISTKQCTELSGVNTPQKTTADIDTDFGTLCKKETEESATDGEIEDTSSHDSMYNKDGLEVPHTTTLGEGDQDMVTTTGGCVATPGMNGVQDEDIVFTPVETTAGSTTGAAAIEEQDNTSITTGATKGHSPQMSTDAV